MDTDYRHGQLHTDAFHTLVIGQRTRHGQLYTGAFHTLTMLLELVMDIVQTRTATD